MNRILSLDVLRGVAVFLVLFRHSEGFDATLLAPLRRGGWIGVDLFFVLSGFLVSGLLFREFDKTGTIQPTRFIVRRGWKIYPAFWALIAFTVLFSGCMFNDFDPAKTLTELTFIQSYVGHRWWNHTWSLAVEEHFYLVLPFVLLLLSRDNFKSLPRLVMILMVGCLGIRLVNSLRPFTEQTHLWNTHLRLDGLFFGVLLCYWHKTWEGFNDFCKRYSYLLVAGGVVMLLPPLFVEQDHRFIHTVGLTLNTLGSGALLMGMVCGSVPVNPLTKFIGWVGFYSYSIYLWHNVVIVIGAPLLGIGNPMFMVLGSVVTGVAMANFIELPMLKLRDYSPASHFAKAKVWTNSFSTAS